MKKTALFLSLMLVLLLTTNSFSAQKVLKIEKQCSFAVGEKIIQRDGVYDNSKFVG